MVELSLVLVVDEVVLFVVVVEVVAVVVAFTVVKVRVELEGLGVLAVDVLLELAATDKTKRPSTSVFHSIAPPPRCLRC